MNLYRALFNIENKITSRELSSKNLTFSRIKWMRKRKSQGETEREREREKENQANNKEQPENI